MKEQFLRTAACLGEDSINVLSNSRVAVFGVGGVGSFTVEALARAGIGFIDLIDSDLVSESNINRQIIALHSTVGQPKVEVMKQRILDINPDCIVKTHQCFYNEETAPDVNLQCFDYIVDAIDSVKSKLDLIIRSKNLNVPIISALGAGNKLDPCRFSVSDIYKTKVCPLAKVVRTNLKKQGITELKVVYSEETPIARADSDLRTPASVPFVPSVMGLIIAGEVIKDLINK